MLDVVPNELLPIDVAPGLVLVNDRMPGITRQRRGTDFAYIGPDARPVTAFAERVRIVGLGIPGSCGDVWICPLANGHVQATARDPMGRKLYRYHPGWRDWRDRAGLGQLLPLGKVLAQMRARIDRDLERRVGDRYFALASLAALLDGRPSGAGLAGAERRLQRIALLRDLRNPGGTDRLLPASAEVTADQLDRYLAELSGLDQINTRSLLAWSASSAAFATALSARGPLTVRAMAEAAARSLGGATTAAGVAYIDPDVLALAELPVAMRRDRLDTLPPHGTARLGMAERRYLGFLERRP